MRHRGLITLENVLIDATRPQANRSYAPGEVLGDERDSPIVEFVEKERMEFLHFEWTHHEYLDVTLEEATTLGNAGYTITSSHGGGQHTYAKFARMRSHLWFCNFRRYSWSWSTCESGDQGDGFARGPVYANGHVFAGLAETPRDVVLYSALMAWGEFKATELPDFFGGEEVQRLFAELVEKALTNVSTRADPAHTTGPYLTKPFEIVRRQKA